MKTYEAIIDGDKLTWIGERPVSTDQLPVTVSLRSEPVRGTDGAELVKVIEQIRAEGGVTCFGDGMEWQRQERVDRPMPGREP